MKALRYKFVELSTVTDQQIEDTVNEWVGRGWQLDGVRFAMSDASRRPAMAFVSFVREDAAAAPGARTGVEEEEDAVAEVVSDGEDG